VGVVRRLATVFAVVVAGAVAIAGCGSPGEVPPEAAAQPLIPDDTGRIDRTKTGTTGIEGRWHVFSDGTNPEGVASGTCQNNGHDSAQCSTVITPDPTAMMFPPTVVNGFVLGMCVVGVAARIISDASGNPDYAHIWGLGIGVSFNGVQAVYDAPAHEVTGIAFDIDSEPPPRGGILVEVPTDATALQPAWWGGATDDTSPVHAGHNEFRWASVGGPVYATSPPAFDATRILEILFHAVSDPDGPETVSFCISNLTALRN
jgi:hypothetical protein